MKLSKLVYLCVKNAVYYDDASFTYDAFIRGKADNNPDYATNLNNIYMPLNLAIARLNEMNKLPFTVIDLGKADKYEVVIPTEKLTDVKEIIAVAAVEPNKLIRKLNISYSLFDGKITILSDIYPFDTIKLEYKKNIPFLSNSEDLSGEGNFFQYTFDNDDELAYSYDVDITEKYGITDAMSSYIMEYVKGKLLEPVDVHLSNMHVTMAEQYLNNIQSAPSALRQNSTETTYKIGL